MPKNKPHRSSPTIDMTAMCDVAFLLLTFFMLTAKMKPQEIVQVDTPSSISETKLPDANTILITVDDKGKVFLDMAGVHTRMNLINTMNEQYQMGLDEQDKLRFASGGAIGAPNSQLKQFLNTPVPEQGMKFPGVPADTSKNELGPWIQAARVEQFKLKQEGKVSDDYVVVVKADADAPYPAIQKVINTLIDFNVNKFNLITNMEADPNKLKGLGK